LFLLLIASLAFGAPDLPRWSDDSGMIVTPYPARFSPALESTNLVTRIFHDVDTRVDITWTLVITDANGTEVRHFRQRQTYLPGEAMQFAPAWNGRDDAGRFLPDGAYTVTATALLRASGPRVRDLHREDSIEEPERVESIRQSFAGTLIIDSTRRGR